MLKKRRETAENGLRNYGKLKFPGFLMVSQDCMYIYPDLASLPDPEGRLRHSQPWLCRDLALIGERALLGVKGPIRSETETETVYISHYAYG